MATSRVQQEKLDQVSYRAREGKTQFHCICNMPENPSFFYFKLTPVKSAGRDFIVCVCMGLAPGGVDAIQGKEQHPPVCCESSRAWLACRLSSTPVGSLPREAHRLLTL